MAHSMVALAEVPGELGVLDELVASARRLLAARYGIALLVGGDGRPTALSHQGMTTADMAAMPHLPRPVGLVGVVLAGQVLRLEKMSDHPASAGFPVGHIAMGPLLGLPDTPTTTSAPARHIDHLTEAARTVLEVDVAFLSHLAAGKQTCTHVSSRAGGPPLDAGLCVPEETCYCSAMVRGDLPSTIPDTADHPVTAATPVTAALGVGSYSGVTVVLTDGTLHGTLGTLDSAATTQAEGTARTQTLQVLARLVALQVDRQLQERRRRDVDQALLEPLLDGSRRTTVLQPIVELATGETVGYEALSRFTDIHGSALRPDLVFAEAARLDLGVRLEQAALASALALLPRIPASRYLSVNLSPIALADPGTHDLLTAAPATRLLVEITEHDAVLDYPALARLLEHQRARGIRIAVDDAGSGYASLQHITQLNPDVIKLDIALVRDIDTDRNRRAIARALIAYATETNATLVAEGIETPAERDQLLTLGAPLGQGYLLGRPQPFEPLLPPPAAPTRHSTPSSNQVPVLVLVRNS